MKAYEILEQNEWIQNDTALNEQNESVRYHDPSACKFCLHGALLRAYGMDDACSKEMYTASMRVKRVVLDISNLHYVQWNDLPGRTKQDVVNLLKRLDI